MKGQLFLEVQAARDALVLIKGGACRGISIGFLQPKGDKVEYRDDNVRVLKEIHLVELSCVPVPAASRAQITSIKALGDVQRVLKTISDATEPEVISSLRGIDAELKRLLTGGDNSEGNMKDDQATEELAMLKSFAIELKGITG